MVKLTPEHPSNSQVVSGITQCRMFPVRPKSWQLLTNYCVFVSALLMQLEALWGLYLSLAMFSLVPLASVVAETNALRQGHDDDEKAFKRPVNDPWRLRGLLKDFKTP